MLAGALALTLTWSVPADGALGSATLRGLQVEQQQSGLEELEREIGKARMPPGSRWAKVIGTLALAASGVLALSSEPVEGHAPPQAIPKGEAGFFPPSPPEGFMRVGEKSKVLKPTGHDLSLQQVSLRAEVLTAGQLKAALPALMPAGIAPDQIPAVRYEGAAQVEYQVQDREWGRGRPIRAVVTVTIPKIGVALRIGAGPKERIALPGKLYLVLDERGKTQVLKGEGRFFTQSVMNYPVQTFRETLLPADGKAQYVEEFQVSLSSEPAILSIPTEWAFGLLSQWEVSLGRRIPLRHLVRGADWLRARVHDIHRMSRRAGGIGPEPLRDWLRTERKTLDWIEHEAARTKKFLGDQPPVLDTRPVSAPAGQAYLEELEVLRQVTVDVATEAIRLPASAEFAQSEKARAAVQAVLRKAADRLLEIQQGRLEKEVALLTDPAAKARAGILRAERELAVTERRLLAAGTGEEKVRRAAERDGAIRRLYQEHRRYWQAAGKGPLAENQLEQLDLQEKWCEHQAALGMALTLPDLLSSGTDWLTPIQPLLPSVMPGIPAALGPAEVRKRLEALGEIGRRSKELVHREREIRMQAEVREIQEIEKRLREWHPPYWWDLPNWSEVHWRLREHEVQVPARVREGHLKLQAERVRARSLGQEAYEKALWREWQFEWDNRLAYAAVSANDALRNRQAIGQKMKRLEATRRFYEELKERGFSPEHPAEFSFDSLEGLFAPAPAIAYAGTVRVTGADRATRLFIGEAYPGVWLNKPRVIAGVPSDRMVLDPETRRFVPAEAVYQVEDESRPGRTHFVYGILPPRGKGYYPLAGEEGTVRLDPGRPIPLGEVVRTDPKTDQRLPSEYGLIGHVATRVEWVEGPKGPGRYEMVPHFLARHVPIERYRDALKRKGPFDLPWGPGAVDAEGKPNKDSRYFGTMYLGGLDVHAGEPPWVLERYGVRGDPGEKLPALWVPPLRAEVIYEPRIQVDEEGNLVLTLRKQPAAARPAPPRGGLEEFEEGLAGQMRGRDLLSVAELTAWAASFGRTPAELFAAMREIGLSLREPGGRWRSFYRVLTPAGEETDSVKVFSAIKRDGDWHDGAGVLLLAPDGRVILQRQVRDGRLNLSAAGHRELGETAEETVVAETEEETAFKMDPARLRPIPCPIPAGGGLWRFVALRDFAGPEGYDAGGIYRFRPPEPWVAHNSHITHLYSVRLTAEEWERFLPQFEQAKQEGRTEEALDFTLLRAEELAAGVRDEPDRYSPYLRRFFVEPVGNDVAAALAAGAEEATLAGTRSEGMTRVRVPSVVDAHRGLILAGEAMVFLEMVPFIQPVDGQQVPLVAIAENEAQQGKVLSRAGALGLSVSVIDASKEYGGNVMKAALAARNRLAQMGFDYRVTVFLSDLLEVVGFLGVPSPEAFARAAEGSLREQLRNYL